MFTQTHAHTDTFVRQQFSVLFSEDIQGGTEDRLADIKTEQIFSYSSGKRGIRSRYQTARSLSLGRVCVAVPSLALGAKGAKGDSAASADALSAALAGDQRLCVLGARAYLTSFSFALAARARPAGFLHADH